MELSAKSIRFVIEALQHYQAYHDQQIGSAGLSEDELSDLANDREYLEAIKRDFEKHRDALLRGIVEVVE